MENIDSWEVISDEKMGAYLSDKRDSINISNFDDGIDARYSYETEVEKKDYRDYFGKIQHNYKDLKRNPLSTFSRNAWNGLLDLPKGLGDAIIGAGEYVAFKATGGDPEFEKKLAEGANALRAKNDEWFKQWQYVNNQQDNSFVADLGRAGGSLLSSLGLTFITKNPSVVAGAFGASQFGSINKELRERGVDIDRALAISTGLGLAEGALERVGLHLWFENAATKKISTYLLKQGATEFTQEASQTAVEEVSMKLLGERNTEWFDIVKNVIYSGIIGGITGIGGGAVSIPSTEAFKQQAKEKLVEKGFTEEKAQQLVDDAAYSNDEARRDLLELVNKEADQSTLLNGSYEDDVKAFAEAMQQDIVSEAFDIKQELKEKAMTDGGLDEETAEVASTLVENFTKAVYNKTGITPRDLMDEKGLTLIDERYPSPQDEVINESELTEEEIARLDAREKEEFDIPFQTDQLRPGDEGYIPYKDGRADINTPEFKAWFGDSKVVDEQGKPLVVYHGTNAVFDTFDYKKIGKNYLQSEGGFFFSDKKNNYGKINMPVYLSMKNPKIVEVYDYAIEYFDDNRGDILREAWINDNDGIIVKSENKIDKDLYLAFDANQIKSVYNRGTFSPESDNIYYQTDMIRADINNPDIYFQSGTVRRGSYNPTTQVIRLFKETNPSTIIHELGHFFTMKYVRLLEENGQRAELDGFYNWLGINSIDEATTETWEKMARGFETYALEGVAPNLSTESVFQRLKQWLVGVYQDLKGKVIPPEEINDDVREFFDGMLASEQTPIDVSNIKGRTDDLINIINSALKGEEVSIDGLSLKDVKDLIKASNARLPRMPKNLEQVIRSAGGIDVQLAKSLGLYDERKGNLSGFFKEGGAFTKEDSLIEFLKSEGFLSVPESVTYEQTAEMADKAISLLENASQIFRESDLGTVQQRESMAEAAQEAAKLLSKIDYKEVQQALQTLQDKSITGIQNDTLRYIKSRLKRIDSDYRKILNKSLTNQRKDIAQKQTDVINYIKEQPISNEHKFRLINEVKKANKETAYENAIKEVKRRAEGYYEQEQKKILASQIKKEIRKSKPSKVTQQRYDYETNKLFQALREYNKFNQEQASEELNKFIDEEMSNVDLIKMRFLNYKANGMSSSTQLMEKVLDDILQAKRLGTMLKDQAEMEAKINKEELKQEAIAAIQANTADKDKFKTKFTNLYRRGFTNLYSMINSISSRKLAERFEMETVLNDADVTYYRHTDTFTKKAMDIFGVKSRGDLLNKFADMGEVIDTIYAENGNRYDLTKLDIVDIYNAIKNEKTRANYLAAYGEEQVMRVLNLLNQQERFFADAMMEDINSLYPETNKVYVETYGMDLKKVENYWPATSDRIKETDLLGDFYAQQETPSFYKERVKGRVTPLPKNAWEKYLKHVNESIYMVKVARKYKELSDTFKSSRVRNQIENKYGKAVYNELMEQINSISLNSKSASLNYVESAFGSMLNNFVVAKIAVAPTVFAGQLTSITNYSEEVNTVDYYKNFVYGLSHPKEVISFMKKHAGDFLETRYKGGYSEALTRVQREAEQANKRKFKILSDKAKYNVTNALTSFVRVGDLGAIMFGGYAEIQSNLKSGMSLEDAIKKFEFDTLRSQQSSNAASLSSFQKSTGFSRVLLAFKNTQHQYFRKIVDSIIQYQRGEINATQCAKTILNYAVIQGSLYIIAKNAVKAAMGLDDDDDELTDGLLEQLLVGNLDAIPFLSDIAHYAYKRASGEFAGSLLSMPGLDDIERAIMKLYKEDKTIYDWVDVIAPLIEGTTATPVKRYTGMLKKYLEDE